MGRPSSKPVAPPNSLTAGPWREPSSWDEELERSLRSAIRSIIPKIKPNVVFVGPVGAGKSSFINAILSVAKGHKVDLAPVKRGEKSCTTCLEYYQEKNLLPDFRLWDCMGVEQSEADGFHISDMIALLKGHIKEEYEFNPRSPISPENPYYLTNPGIEQQTHCVIFVIDSNAIRTGISPAFLEKIRALQEQVRRLKVQRVLILTKTDILCREVQNDVANMFKSVLVREAVKTASEIFNIPEASIHPVINYEDAFEMSMKKNIPLLIALREIAHRANDRIDHILERSNVD